MSKLRLFVIGDSISIQYGTYLRQMLKEFFEYSRKGDELTHLGLDVDDESINGGDSSAVLKYLKLLLDGGFTTDILLLNCGLHDIKTDPETGTKQVPLEQYQINLKEIIKLGKNIKGKLIWIRTTPVDDQQHLKHTNSFFRYDRDVKAYNQIADQIVREAETDFIDLYGFTKTLDENLYCDHVHFLDSIRKQQAAFLAGHLISMIEKQ